MPGARHSASRIQVANSPDPGQTGVWATSCLAAVAIGTYRPFSPLAKMLGFTALPLSYFAFVAVATALYLLLVQAAKQFLLRGTAQNHAAKQENPPVAAT